MLSKAFTVSCCDINQPSSHSVRDCKTVEQIITVPTKLLKKKTHSPSLPHPLIKSFEVEA